MSRLGWIFVCISGLALIGLVERCFSQQSQPLPEGFYQIDTGRYLRLVTDLPVDDEIRALPSVFDSAMQRWREFFDVPGDQCADWRVTMYLMLDRQRFRQAGLIPSDIPEFQHGWQSGDRIWVSEQPSAYYRRHLMLHEGTHWFMSRKYGKYHAPWLMEGLAELLGTHRIEHDKLTLGILPRDKLEVPFWGRTLLLKQQIEQGSAPSFEAILRYDSSAHQKVEAYAWSWALALFLKEHPDTSSAFAALLRQPAMETAELDRWLRARLKHKFPRLRAEWTAFVNDLDYGYSPAHGMLLSSAETRPLEGPLVFDLAADRNWQATGVRVAAGQKMKVTASGEILVGLEPKPWRCTADGVTLEYHRGQPLGKLMMAMIDPIEHEPKTTEAMKVIPIGSQATLVAEAAGELFFRVNESIAGLSDNSGSLTIEVLPE